MSKNINKLYRISITNNLNEKEFINTIFSLSKEETNLLDFDILDKSIFDNEDINVDIKIFYDNYFNRNYIFKSVMENPMEAPYEYLMYLAKKIPNLRKQLLDILCIRTNNEYWCNYFKNSLSESDLYNSYVDSVINSDDTYLKCHFALFFDYLDEMYPDHMELANTIVKDNDFAQFAKSRSNHLIKLSRMSDNQTVLNYINTIILFVTVKENNEELQMLEEKKIKGKTSL